MVARMAEIEIDGERRLMGTGWIPQWPDLRDYTVDHDEVKVFNKKLGLTKSENALKGLLPSTQDLRQWCSPIENQGSLGSCTAHAASGVVEYYERRAFGRHIEASRLFIYKTTRNLLKWTGDTGAWLRNTMGALQLCGVPPETYWEYTSRMPQLPLIHQEPVDLACRR